MKFPIFLALLVFSFAGFACRKAPIYATTELTQSSLVNTRLAYLDESISPKQLCDDYRLLRSLRYYLHNDDRQSNVPEDCPRDFRDFVLKVKSAIAGLNDLHAQALFGNGLDVASYPVIVACDGDADTCADLMGSPVYPIPSNVETNFYAGVFNRKSKLVPFEVTTVNARTMADYHKAMDAAHLYSHTKANWSQNLMDWVLKRPIITDQDRGLLTIEARNILNQKTLKISASFDSVQRVFPSGEALGVLRTISMGREYGCSDVFELTTFDVGACRRSDGKIIVWLANWPQADVFEQWQAALANWLSGHKAESVYLDLRSNGGGSPLSVVSFLCRFGDEDSVAAIGRMELSIRSWPKSFMNEGTLIDSQSFSVLDNLELRRIDQAFEVTAFAKEEPRLFTMNTFERTKTDAKACEGLRVEALKAAKWKVLTDGGEFSAAEDFLFVAKQSPKKFTIYGRPSVGGAGNPSWISLPHTKAGIRLSLARPFYDQKAIIEKIGVAPDFVIQTQDSPEEMEGRIRRFADKGILFKDDVIPKNLWDQFYSK